MPASSAPIKLSAATDKAYSRPPRSTAEIIHPGTLYTGAEPFTPADLSVPDAAVSGATPYFTNVAGEVGIATLIHFHAPQEVAAPAAEGWMGDRYWAYAAEGDTGGDHIVWRTRWRSAADAEEFFKAMRRSLMDRYSIPWQQEYDAVPGTFQVNDPRRIIRLTWSAEKKSVLLINAMSPAFATAAAEKFAPLD